MADSSIFQKKVLKFWMVGALSVLSIYFSVCSVIQFLSIHNYFLFTGNVDEEMPQSRPADTSSADIAKAPEPTYRPPAAPSTADLPDHVLVTSSAVPKTAATAFMPPPLIPIPAKAVTSSTSSTATAPQLEPTTTPFETKQKSQSKANFSDESLDSDLDLDLDDIDPSVSIFLE